MKRNTLQPLLILLLILTGLTGCLGDDDDSDDEDTPSTIQAPVWEVGKFWVYAFTTPEETDIATRLVVAPDDGTNHLVGAASAEEARRHAILNYNPLLGRVELNNFSVYEEGQPQPLFHFPLKKGDSWSFSFLGVSGWEARVGSIKRVSIPSMGETVIVDIHAEAPGGEVMDYSFDTAAGWVHLMRAKDASNNTIVNMSLVSHGSGYSGQVHFMRGLDLFDRIYTSNGGPVVDVYDTFLDSGHPDHGDFDTLVIFLQYRIGESSGGSLSIKDHASNEVFIRTFSSEQNKDELSEIEDEAGEYGVTVNLEGSCDLRVRVAGGIMYNWDV
jgi:hypothetical protein